LPSQIPPSITAKRSPVRIIEFQPRSDHQFARPIRDRLHRFNGIHHQVDGHLLQLDPVTHRGQGLLQERCLSPLISLLLLRRVNPKSRRPNIAPDLIEKTEG
jgi:hypothetical protein